MIGIGGVEKETSDDWKGAFTGFGREWPNSNSGAVNVKVPIEPVSKSCLGEVKSEKWKAEMTSNECWIQTFKCKWVEEEMRYGSEQPCARHLITHISTSWGVSKQTNERSEVRD